ncbi:hypothetical protein HPP92_008700 [Vanilla planifolia]|uniref:Uncharacterized protein n=1 Tax=Vanilla planifolia TaxID=51239 RepID=A0A835R8J6_VANPL|nr:hypothetical protein HPP92_008700 [Vanilla planifolia]
MGGLEFPKFVVTNETMEEEENDDINEEMETESEAGSEDIPLSEPSKNAVYNREGLLEKLEDIAWPRDVDWIHKLTVDYDHAEAVDVNDDLTRELGFYNQALNGARNAFDKLQSMGIPFLRPPDFYAEMVKSDTHMLKIKSKLLAQKKRIEEAEERKKARETKKIAKEVQAQKMKEKAKRKKEEIESVKNGGNRGSKVGLQEGRVQNWILGKAAETTYTGLSGGPGWLPVIDRAALKQGCE